LDGVTLDEVVQPVQEICVFHHVRHDVLPLVVQVPRVPGADETLVLAVVSPGTH